MFGNSDDIKTLNQKKERIAEFQNVKIWNDGTKQTNPYENIETMGFLNRAAVKLAEIDAAYDFLFSNNENVTFADICGGPGGFADYITYRCGLTVRGFCITLAGRDNYDLPAFKYGDPYSLKFVYGSDGHGNIYNEETRIDFKDEIMRNTNNLGVDFVCADGAVPCKGYESNQEYLSLHLYATQISLGLATVREGGSMILKLFDCFTIFSANIIYCAKLAFERIDIMKPKTSRPCNSERYLICLYRKSKTETDVVEQILSRVCKNISNKMVLYGDIISNLIKMKTNVMLEVFPKFIDIIDQEFVVWLKDKLHNLTTQQIQALDRAYEFCIGTRPFDNTYHINCNDLRNLLKISPVETVSEVYYNYFGGALNFKNHPPSLYYDYKYLKCMSKGRIFSYRKNDGVLYILQYKKINGNISIFFQPGLKWTGILPKNFIVFGEMNDVTLTIIDAFWIGNCNLLKKKFNERQIIIEKFCATMSSCYRYDPKYTNRLQTAKFCDDLSDTNEEFSNFTLFYPFTRDEWMETRNEKQEISYYNAELRKYARNRVTTRKIDLSFFDSLNNRIYRTN